FSAPLSVEKARIVLFSSPLSLRYFITAPTISSSCAIPASSWVQPFSGVRICSYFSDKCVTTCIRVGFSQRKNGLPSSFALSRNLSVFDKISSSTVSMRFGQSSPASSILCFPTLPQRESTVGSSTVVAQLWIMLRGPTVDFSAGG